MTIVPNNLAPVEVVVNTVDISHEVSVFTQNYNISVNLAPTVQQYTPPNSGGLVSYTHYQETALDEWIINHPFGQTPVSLILRGEDGNIMLEDTAEYSAVRVVLLFGQPTKGSVILLKG